MSPTNHYQAYKSANQTVSKTRQIVMLYDGMIRFLKQAKEAMQEGRIEERYTLLVKTSDIVIGLQGCLDFEQSEEVATSLYDFYTDIDTRLMALHRSKDDTSYDSLISELKSMRDMWHEMDQGQAATENTPHQQPQDTAPARPAEAHDHSNVCVSA